MRIDRSIRTSFVLAVAALLALGTVGSSATTLGSRSGTGYHPSSQLAHPRVASGCGLVQQSFALGGSGETISLPQDCGGSGKSKVPGILDASAGFSLSVCLSPQAIVPSSGPCAAQPTEYPASSSPCTVSTGGVGGSNGTFLYATEYLSNSIPPSEGPSNYPAAFEKGKIPLTLTNPAFAAPPSQGGLAGAEFGLCVVAFGIVIQDDFAGIGGRSPVTPTGGKHDTLHLKLVLPEKEGSKKDPPEYWPFPVGVPASVFIQYNYT